MVFIVDMFWGRPNEITIYDYDEDGELIPKEVIKSPNPPDPERRFFSCHWSTWRQALELGRAHGWNPSGTAPAESSADRWKQSANFSGDYDPTDILYSKTVLKEDAARWADALEVALDRVRKREIEPDPEPQPVVIVEGMTETEFERANTGITERFLTDFIAFLRKGQFNFCWDD